MVRSMLFDLGNVLVRFDPVLFWTSLNLADPMQQETLAPRMLDLGRLYECGAIDTKEFRERCRSLFDGQFSDQHIHDAFLSVLPAPIEGTEALVRRVARRCETGLVSNTNPVHFNLCLRTTPALRHFDRYYVSYDLGVMKPDPRFYQKIVEREGNPAGSMIFIDDLPENIEGARREGFDAILFRGAEDLERDLKDRGVL